MIPVRTIGAHVARRCMHEAVTLHLVFALEAFATAALAVGTAAHGAVV